MKKMITFVYGASYLLIGIAHFTHTDLFTPIVPQLIGFPELWVYLSGVVELALGLGLFFQRTRRHAAFLLIPLLLILYTANFNMWWNDIPFNGVIMGPLGHLFRAFAQLLLLILALWIGNIWPFSMPSLAPEEVSG